MIARTNEVEIFLSLTGHVGFEPTNAGIKILCLAAWRMPYNLLPHKSYGKYLNECTKSENILTEAGFSFPDTISAIINPMSTSAIVVVIFKVNICDLLKTDISSTGFQAV